MDETEREELKEAYKKEKDLRVVARILAVHMRHDPQLRIGPSMPIILQMCAPKHATFV